MKLTVRDLLSTIVEHKLSMDDEFEFKLTPETEEMDNEHWEVNLVDYKVTSIRGGICKTYIMMFDLQPSGKGNGDYE